MTLDEFIDVQRTRPFAYFENDCVSIAADWVLEKSGRDILAELRAPGGAYASHNLLTAMRVFRQAGGFVEAASQLLGLHVPGLTAQRGDVVLALSGGKIGRVSGYSFGVCTGSHIAAPGTDQLEFLPLTAGVAAWRV